MSCLLKSPCHCERNEVERSNLLKDCFVLIVHLGLEDVLITPKVQKNKYVVAKSAPPRNDTRSRRF